MPEQRGKRRKRPRRRPAGSASAQSPITESETTAAPTTSRSSRPARRKSPQLPPWGNLAFGFIIIGAGVYFFSRQSGPLTGTRILLLVLYAGLASLYFGRAYRQYRSK